MLQDQSPNSIRITEDEANSEHVEGLLARQMSLRGERGITAVKKRRWWLQNWFILMMVGGMAAFAAWIVIEPYFDDACYFQGTLTRENLDYDGPIVVDNFQFEQRAAGRITIGDQQIWILDDTKFWIDGKGRDLDESQLKRGQEIAAYVDYRKIDDVELAVARFIVPNPSPRAADYVQKSLSQLASQHTAAGLLLFPLVAGLVGMAIGAADGIVCRLPKRALLSGLIGLLIGILGGFLSELLAMMVYAPLSALAMKQGLGEGGKLPPFAFVTQMAGRGIAWLLAGMAMGLAQGIALRSKRLFIYGLIGGLVGGLLGGLLFDPVDILILGREKPSSHIARMVGLTVIGLFVGAMIGVVELLARDAWLRMTEGPLTGKEFLLFKDVMRIGSSSRSDLYLFNDPQVAETHAQIRTSGDHSEIESDGPDKLVLVNGRPVRSTRLRHGDSITIGRTSFLFQSKKG